MVQALVEEVVSSFYCLLHSGRLTIEVHMCGIWDNNSFRSARETLCQSSSVPERSCSFSGDQKSWLLKVDIGKVKAHQTQPGVVRCASTFYFLREGDRHGEYGSSGQLAQGQVEYSHPASRGYRVDTQEFFQ